MKNCLLFLSLLLYSIHLQSQDFLEQETYVSNQIIDQTYGLPTVRSVGGGTKFIVEYQGEWTEDMKGAFEYACKIWEEAMPTTFPIHVLAKLDETRNTTALSKVSISSRIHTDDVFSNKNPSTNMSTWTQIKGTTMAEYMGIYTTRIYEDVLTPNMFYENDIAITYYNKGNKLKNNCSFSLSENIDNTKYDFITLVLRDIAKGFGIIWSYNNPNLWPNVINTERETPYESKILNQLGFGKPGTTQASMYEKATQGSLQISGNLASTVSLQLYAPTQWDMDNSLSTFIPNNNQKITKLLSYNFGKGSVIRDIADNTTFDLFRDILDWKGDIAVGIGQSNEATDEISNKNNNFIPFNGSVSIDTKQIPLSQSIKPYISKANLEQEEDTIYNIIKKFHPNYDGTDITNHYSGTISLLLNDGTWDKVCSFYPGLQYTISVSDFKLHHLNQDYARTTDGYLRCRISNMEYVNNKYRTKARYYALDYLPQKAIMSKSKVLNIYEDDYYADVEISYKNIEGTTRIIVSQYDDGEDVPFQFFLSDIKSGKFTATVDKEYPTKFIITSYNQNGSTTSETYILDPIQPITDLDLSFILSNGCIEVKSNSKRMNDKILIKSYTINSLDNLLQSRTERTQKLPSVNQKTNSNLINVSELSSGMYILTVNDIFGKNHSFKFAVK